MKPLAIVLALVFFVLAILYGIGTLQLLASTPGPHYKHAIIFAVLGLLALIWYRFQSADTSRIR